MNDYIILVDSDIVRDTQILDTEHENFRQALASGNWETDADTRDFHGQIVLCTMYKKATPELARFEASNQFHINMDFLIAIKLA